MLARPVVGVQQVQKCTFCSDHRVADRSAARWNRASSSASPQLQTQTTQAVQVPNDILRVLFTEQQVKDKVKEIGRQIGTHYQGEKLCIVGVLTGAFILTADLVRNIEPHVNDMQVDFVKASSYGSASESSGAVEVKHIQRGSWSGRHVLLVEDIIDSGHTLNRLSEELKEAGALSVKVVALLDKKGRRRVEFFPDYVGFECPDEFVVGYGLDYNERYRWLPYVAALKPEAYS